MGVCLLPNKKLGCFFVPKEGFNKFSGAIVQVDIGELVVKEPGLDILVVGLSFFSPLHFGASFVSTPISSL